MSVKRFVKIALAMTACLGLVAGCSGGADKAGKTSQGGDRANSADAGKSLGDVQVYGAASLNTVLPEIGDATVVKDHPGTKLLFNFNGSSSLVDEMAGGAPVDILLTADEKNMKKALEKNLVKDPQIFTANTLVLVVPKGNPGAIKGFADGTLDGKKLVICAPEVPCGNATAKLSELNNVKLAPVSEEQSVSDVLDKVASGEADAGVVYKTDAKLKADKVEVIEIPKADQVVNNYMIAVAAGAPNPEGAKAVLDAVMSDAGQAALEKYGFLPAAKISSAQK
ncbi:MAG: molybdate ABC transporter substrate-binding protein [Actinomycetaceae bacterium]|nr:molybdate ABC transporter substrate-binding protein [Arcanobacterium sp.]MDD7687047.1 molybdate ABC transporter substrate-binding protein [Actinomycetaceae bacterium]MDY5273296.1 molybdate ABC transporter substrate-binding protein [Arcanobacterium sp.]